MRVRTITAVLPLLALSVVGTVAGTAEASASASAGPTIEVSPPQMIGSGLTSQEFETTIVNSGGIDRFGVSLRYVFTPVTGSPVRPLAAVLNLEYLSGSGYRKLSYTTDGDRLIASTPARYTVAGGASTTVTLRISTTATSTAPHVDSSTVTLTTEAVDDTSQTFAVDPRPDQITMVEPRAELSGLPARLRVGEPAVVTARFVNSTPLTYALVLPALSLYRLGNENVTVEWWNNGAWQPIGLSNKYHWLYHQYATAAPGETSSDLLRITFRANLATDEQCNLYHMISSAFGTPITAEIHPFTVVPR